MTPHRAPADLIAEARRLVEPLTSGGWLASDWGDGDWVVSCAEGPVAAMGSNPHGEAEARFVARARTLVVELADALEQACQTIEVLRGPGYTADQLADLVDQTRQCVCGHPLSEHSHHCVDGMCLAPVVWSPRPCPCTEFRAAT